MAVIDRTSRLCREYATINEVEAPGNILPEASKGNANNLQ